MDATAFHSVIMVFWKATAFRLWTAIERCWTKKVVYVVSSVTAVVIIITMIIINFLTIYLDLCFQCTWGLSEERSPCSSAPAQDLAREFPEIRHTIPAAFQPPQPAPPPATIHLLTHCLITYLLICMIQALSIPCCQSMWMSVCGRICPQLWG